MTTHRRSVYAEQSASDTILTDVPANWHTQSVEKTLDSLKVDPARGLSDEEVRERLEQYGLNEIREGTRTSILQLLWQQLTEPLVLILLLAAGISAALGKVEELIAILAIVILNAFLGIFQEYRAEKAIAALRKMSQPVVRVIRGGREDEVDAAKLVPGDVIVLEAGNIVAADARLIESNALRVQEASLTGESYPVDKTPTALDDDKLSIGDRRNMLYMGTSVAVGRGKAVVTETGMRSELGRIAEMIQSVESEGSPLQRRMAQLGKIMFGAAFVVMGLAFLIGLITGQALDQILLNSVAIAVAVVPEGLPAVVTISLALGAQRMLKRRALIRKLPAVETLGSVTVIASDKTGTLTQNRMTMKILDVAGDTLDASDLIQHHEKGVLPPNRSMQLSLIGASLANDARYDTAANLIVGDPTEGALIEAAYRYQIDPDTLKESLPRLAEQPFTSERKMMSTLHLNDGAHPLLDEIGTRYMGFTKGAPDRVLEFATAVYVNGEVQPMTPEMRQRIEDKASELASDGLRVLGVAFKPMTEPDARHIESDLIYTGLIGLIDPPRPEVAAAVEKSKRAGIRPIMITGDHPMTAMAIAQQLGIADEDDRAVTGYQLAEMSDEELSEVVHDVAVFARVAPEHKLRIVRALQNDGQIVAMTGDGVNDAPALKQADMGVSMGVTGTDVAKEASDMVITDDNFATIVAATEEGRAIFDNFRRFIKYLLASNTGELFVLLATQLVSGMTIPLTTLQILWMNLITDGIPALALGVEKAEENAMDRPPYDPNENILARGLGRHILLIGGTLGISALLLGVIAFNAGWEAANGLPAWNTMVFFMLTVAQMGHALGLRSHSQSIFRMSIFENRYLFMAVISTLVLQLAAVYLPFFNDLFGTNPLTLWQLGISFGLSFIVLAVVEIEKILIRRGIFS